MHTIHTDGSCINNGLPTARAGWSFVVKNPAGEVVHQDFGKLPGPKQGNQKAELYALYQAFVWMKNHPEIKATIYSDSRTAVCGITGENKRTANRDLWDPIEAMAPSITSLINIIFIESEYNAEADALAYKGANALFVFNKKRSA